MRKLFNTLFTSKSKKIILFSSTLTSLYLIDKNFNHSNSIRTCRTVLAGGIIVFNYKVLWDITDDYDSIHARTADLILKTCQKNGGLYIKFGQSLASMNHLLRN